MNQINQRLRDFMKSDLKDMLSKCTPGEQHRFKQMYSHKNLDIDINTVVDNFVDGNEMSTSDLMWKINNAMNQCERTIQKKTEA